MKDQNGNDVTAGCVVNGKLTLTTELVAIDKSVKVKLVFNQDAIVTIDGKEYLADQDIDLVPGTYDFKAEYADTVISGADVETGDGNISVKVYGSAEKLVVTGAGTLTIGKIAPAVLTVIDTKGDGVTPVGSIVAGQTLGVNVTLSDGSEIGTYPVNPNVTYQWFTGADNKLGTGATQTVTADNAGSKISVTVTYNGVSMTWTSDAAIEKVNPAELTVIDTKGDGVTPVANPVSGQTLGVNVTLNDGTKIGTYPVDGNVTYQWFKGDNTQLGTAPTQVLTDDNVGSKIGVTVTYNGESMTWTSDVDVAPANP